MLINLLYGMLKPNTERPKNIFVGISKLLLMSYGYSMERKNTNDMKCIYLITTLFISEFTSSFIVNVCYTNRVNFS